MQKNESRFPDNVLVADIVRGLPVADGSADGVYASHVLEHLTRSDFETALQNTYRILRSGGLFRLIVPDLEARARLYVSKLDAGQKDANDWFMLSTYSDFRTARFPGKKAGRFGTSLHLWMWDFPSMEVNLPAGFVNIRRCSLGDSEDPMFIRVEEPSRFFDASNNIDELAVQASKP